MHRFGSGYNSAPNPPARTGESFLLLPLWGFCSSAPVTCVLSNQDGEGDWLREWVSITSGVVPDGALQVVKY